MLEGIRVLVIDDDDDTRELYEVCWARAGVDIRTAATAREGLEIALRDAPDAIVSDLMLPDASGIDLVRELRAAGYRVPAIAVTGSVGYEDEEEALAAGFTAYRLKPCSPDELLEMIARLVRRSG